MLKLQHIGNVYFVVFAFVACVQTSPISFVALGNVTTSLSPIFREGRGRLYTGYAFGILFFF